MHVMCAWTALLVRLECTLGAPEVHFVHTRYFIMHGEGGSALTVVVGGEGVGEEEGKCTNGIKHNYCSVYTIIVPSTQLLLPGVHLRCTWSAL